MLDDWFYVLPGGNLSVLAESSSLNALQTFKSLVGVEVGEGSGCSVNRGPRALRAPKGHQCNGKIRHENNKLTYQKKLTTKCVKVVHTRFSTAGEVI